MSQFAERHGIIALNTIKRQNSIEKAPFVRHRIAEQETVKPGTPGVLTVWRQMQLRPVIFIHPPADASLFDPAANRIELMLIEAEAAAHRRRREQVEQSGRGETCPVKVEQLEKRRSNLPLVQQTPVGNRVREIGRSVSGGTEHCGDIGSIGLDIRTHHHDILRRKPGELVEKFEQIVVQHLDFAQRAVAGVHLYRSVEKLC